MTDSPKRVVSLIAASTEIVHALGCGDWLVGRSHECDYPPGVKGLPVCTAPKFPVEGTSYEVDQRVRAIVEQGLAVYRVFADKLAECDPDVIITQAQCEVCAVSLKDVEAAVCELSGRQPQVVSLVPNALADVWNDFRKVARALGVAAHGESVIQELQARMRAIERAATGLKARPRVACIEWIDPLMAAGNWMPELVMMAGGTNLFGEPGAHTPFLAWEALYDADPDAILVLPCGWDAPRAREEMPALTGRAEWPKLKAVRTGNVYLLDGNQYFNRPGPRLVESLEILAEILHPDTFDFGHKGAGWQVF